jgi:hypothetical protein
MIEDWDEYLQIVAHCYRTTVHTSLFYIQLMGERVLAEQAPYAICGEIGQNVESTETCCMILRRNFCFNYGSVCLGYGEQLHMSTSIHNLLFFILSTV